MSDNNVQEEFRSDDGYSTVPGPVAPAGSATLPNSNNNAEPMPTLSKAGMIGAIVSAAHRMDKDTLSKVYKATISQAGVSKDAGEARPKIASVTPGQIVKEDLDELLGSQNDLTEDFRLKAATLFEAAVNVKATQIAAQLEEEAAEALEEAVQAIEEQAAEAIEQQVQLAINEWIEENQLAIKSTIKADLHESFMAGLKALFEEHYIEMPEDKVDLVNEMASRVEELEEEVNSRTAEFLSLQEEINTLRKSQAIVEATAGLSEAQADRFKTLAEAVDFSDTFADKLAVIKESIVGAPAKVNAESLLTEEVEAPAPVKAPANMAPEVAAVLAVARSKR
jgi:flagellar biosynthesis/type III secretory pathway protein FliH